MEAEDWPGGLTNGDLFGLFASSSSSAFHAICSLIVRGIAASPSKARKRSSCLEFFCALYQNSEWVCGENNAVVSQYHAVLGKHTGDRGKKTKQDANTQVNPEEVTMNFTQIYEGLKLFSQRLSEYPMDELLTLALLMDVNNDGVVDFADFYDFCIVIDQSQYSHVNQAHCFECLFSDLLQQKTINVTTSLPKLESSLISLRQNKIPTMPLLLENLREQAPGVEVTPAILGDVVQSVVSSLNGKVNRIETTPAADISKTDIGSRQQPSTATTDNSPLKELGDLRERSQIIRSRINRTCDPQVYGNLLNALAVMEQEIEKVHPANTNTFVNDAGQDSQRSPPPIAFTKSSSDVSNLSVDTTSSMNSHGIRRLSMSMGNGNGTPVVRSGNSLRRESTFVQKTLEHHRENTTQMATDASDTFKLFDEASINDSAPHNQISPSNASINSSMNSSISTSMSRRSSISPKNPLQTTNLSIFKGPQSHIHGNKNSYDNRRLSWKPSTAPRKEERFQTTNELRDLEKISKFLYTNN